MTRYDHSEGSATIKNPVGYCVNPVGFEVHFVRSAARHDFCVRFREPSVRQAERGEGVRSGKAWRRRKKRKRTCPSFLDRSHQHEKCIKSVWFAV